MADACETGGPPPSLDPAWATARAGLRLLYGGSVAWFLALLVLAALALVGVATGSRGFGTLAVAVGAGVLVTAVIDVLLCLGLARFAALPAAVGARRSARWALSLQVLRTALVWLALVVALIAATGPASRGPALGVARAGANLAVLLTPAAITLLLVAVRQAGRFLAEPQLVRRAGRTLALLVASLGLVLLQLASLPTLERSSAGRALLPVFGTLLLVLSVVTLITFLRTLQTGVAALGRAAERVAAVASLD
jgi:hypothetical protein